jgi:peroxiredoxin
MITSAILVSALLLAASGAGQASAPQAAATQAAPTPRVVPGERFPAMTVTALLPDANAARTPMPVDLGFFIGKKPLVICYLVAGNPSSEEVCGEAEKLALDELRGGAEMVYAVKLGPGSTPAGAEEWRARRGLRAPLILEREHRLGAALGAFTSPSLTLIDASGVLRIPDAKSLKQPVDPQISFGQAVREAVARRPVPTIQRLPQYYPVTELVGQKAPDFDLAQFQAPGRFKLSQAAAAGKKITVLFFWHPNCKHCKLLMPSIVAGVHSAPEQVRLVSVVDLAGEDEAVNCADAVKAHGVPQPILVDDGKRVYEAYKVVSTPTLVFVRPDGVVDSVYTSARMNFVPVMNAKLQSILGLKPRLAPGAP